MRIERNKRNQFDAQSTYVVLLLQVLGQRRAHEDATRGRVRAEVGLASLAARGGDGGMELHCSIKAQARRLTSYSRHRMVLLK